MFTSYKLWYIFIYLKHWVKGHTSKRMVRLDNVGAPVNQPHRLGGPIPERFNLHRLRNMAPSKMLEGAQNLVE